MNKFTLEHDLAVYRKELAVTQKALDGFEYEISDDEWDEILDSNEDSVNVCGMDFYPSDILKNCDPIAYRCGKSDYEGSYDIEDLEEYKELQEKISDLELEIDSLEEKIFDLEGED